MPTPEYPLLIIGDSVSSGTGLARITYDIASRIHAYLSDVFRIKTVGWNGGPRPRVPWPTERVSHTDDWIIPDLPDLADEFANGQELIILFICDIARLTWFALPDHCPNLLVRKWLETDRIRKWTYHAVDAEGPNGKFGFNQAKTLKGFERVLDYSAFSSGVSGNSDHLPHGIDCSVFFPHDKLEARKRFHDAGFVALEDDTFLVGIIATNQPRKDWALGVQTARILLDRGLKVQLWCHSDAFERHWDLASLLIDYGMIGHAIITVDKFPDAEMSWFLSACDVTLGIGAGEGFGYPIYESLASGTTCIHHDYGGGAEWLPLAMRVPPVAYRYEGPHCLKRPVGDPEAWTAFADQAAYICKASLPEELDWNNLWPRWKQWLLKGVGL